MSFHNHKGMGVAALVAVLVFVLGILIGFFSKTFYGPNSGACPSAKLDQLTKEADHGITDTLQGLIDVQHMDNVYRELTSKPRLAGTDSQRESADYVHNLFKEYGLASQIETYDVFLSYPVEGQNNYAAVIDEDENVQYRTVSLEELTREDTRHPDEIQAFNAFSPSGDVIADLVYANYGRAEDFDKLHELGINCSGKIVIARYGKIFRGNKVLFAHQAGCVGVILYSDPADYGPPPSNSTSGMADPYPDTWWLPETGIQRGNIIMTKGDQATPGYPALWYTQRLSEEELKDKLPVIPCHPIGYRDAFNILGEMEGDEVLPEWRGNLNITYRFGPRLRGNRKIKLVVNNENRTVPIHNVIGQITGAIEPDRYVIFGNHRDAWIYGGADPASGGIVLIEIARIFGKLLETGWRPRRTLLFCSWDAEEYGLVGSYEWVEDNLKWLTSNAVAYINIDSAVSGNRTLRLKTVPLLQQVFFDAAKQVPDPHITSQSVFDVWRGELDKPRTYRIGSGSDHTPFVANAGVPSLYAKFAKTDDWESTGTPLYHTRYETTTLLMMIDPGYKISSTMVGLLAETGRRLSDSLILPLGVGDYVKDLRESVNSLNTSVFGIVEEKYLNGVIMGSEALAEAVDKFEKTAEETDMQNPIAIRNVNDKMMAVERAFLDINGIPYRPHYKHLLHTPSATNHYGGQGFPGAEDLFFRWNHNKTQSAARELEGHLSVLAHAFFSKFITVAATMILY
ncbi:N-acetylated-alpha-linked acidic dipeptidase 2-like [Ylistrum balloti]|uniref:N-acetylated-alpha-linked acidic dipeptidase 2-like n=1 Tax=Ylistrum balloti TaxID=509963 RepID=UPI002905E7EB|nr:N-acetylated-alpha-linked acidic dipeptidase 2-like [Ylistrum balloti]